MKLSDIKVGMQLKATANVGDCIESDRLYDVLSEDDALYIRCSSGQHWLEPMTNDSGELPEFEQHIVT